MLDDGQALINTATEGSVINKGLLERGKALINHGRKESKELDAKLSNATQELMELEASRGSSN